MLNSSTFLNLLKYALMNLIIKGTLRLGIFVVLGHRGLKVAWRCRGSYPDPQIPNLMS